MLEIIKEYIAEKGIRAFVKEGLVMIPKIGLLIGRRLCSSMNIIIYRVYLNQVSSSMEALIPIRIEQVTELNVEDISQVESSYKVSQFKKFMAKKRVGFYVYVDTNIAHRCWVVDHGHSVPTCGGYDSFPLEDKEFFIHYSTTYPRFQRKGIYKATLTYLCGYYCKNGYTKGLIAVDSRNIPSTKVVKNLGFVPVKKQRVQFFMGFTFRNSKTISGGETSS